MVTQVVPVPYNEWIYASDLPPYLLNIRTGSINPHTSDNDRLCYDLERSFVLFDKIYRPPRQTQQRPQYVICSIAFEDDSGYLELSDFTDSPTWSDVAAQEVAYSRAVNGWLYYQRTNGREA